LSVEDLAGSAALLERWAVDHYGTGAVIEELRPMPGHGGLSFGFDVVAGDRRDPLVVRVPPPGVRRHAATDVLRQVPVLQAARAAGVPVPEVRWWSDDERWFAAPFFMVERLAGTSIDCWEPVSMDSLSVRRVFRQAIEALVTIHQLPWRAQLAGWSVPRSLGVEIAAWEPVLAKGENPDWVKQGLELRDLLLTRRPGEPEPGLFHGDFYSNNWVCTGEQLLAVVDWETASLGASLLDVGWLCMMYDRESWGPTRQAFMTWSPPPDEIVAMYEGASGQAVADVNWYRALAAWRMSCTTALFYRLHVTGRRPDPTWELFAEAFSPMVERGRRLLGA
jgi:aminoglycoside phosphotransferase (APT) family kinase protein